MIDAKANTTPLQALVPATRTSSANGTGVDIRDYIGIAEATLDVGAVSGTAPTLDVKIQDSPDNSTFSDVAGATFTQVTTANNIQSIAVNIDSAARYIRAVATIAGTTPSFACGVNVRGIKQAT